MSKHRWKLHAPLEVRFVVAPLRGPTPERATVRLDIFPPDPRLHRAHRPEPGPATPRPGPRTEEFKTGLTCSGLRRRIENYEHGRSSQRW